jgi:hypothetical protein
VGECFNDAVGNQCDVYWFYPGDSLAQRPQAVLIDGMAFDSSPSHHLILRPLSGNALVQLVELVTAGEVASSRVQAAGLVLLGHSPVLRRRKSAVSHGEGPEVNLASEREREIKKSG